MQGLGEDADEEDTAPAESTQGHAVAVAGAHERWTGVSSVVSFGKDGASTMPVLLRGGVGRRREEAAGFDVVTAAARRIGDEVSEAGRRVTRSQTQGVDVWSRSRLAGHTTADGRSRPRPSGRALRPAAWAAGSARQRRAGDNGQRWLQLRS